MNENGLGGVEREDKDGVVWITVSRPEKLNVLNSDLIANLTAQFVELKSLTETDAVRAVVLTGAGDRAFVGGADISEMAGLDEISARSFISGLHGAMAAIRDLPVPVIARINGYSLGGGMELAAACDIRISSDHAKFGMPEVRVGLPSVIEAALLPGLIGWGRTRWLLLTGEMIDAPTAYDWGFMEKMTSLSGLDAAVSETLAAILDAGPEAVRTQKSLIRSWETMAADEAIAASIPVFAGSFARGEPQRMLGEFVAKKSRK